MQHRYWRVATLDKREEKESEKNQIRVGWSRDVVHPPEFPPPSSSACGSSSFPWPPPPPPLALFPCATAA